MQNLQALEYLKKEGLGQYINLDSEYKLGVDDAVSGKLNTPIPPNCDDLARIHKLIRDRKSFTVLELGVGFSTIIIADALKKNNEDWNNLENKPKIRNRFMFKCFSVDSSESWLKTAQERLPEELQEFIVFHFSKVNIGTHNGQICHFYDNLPDIIADFIYVDGPDPKTVDGKINGMSFQCDERTVMSADLLLIEPILLPGTFIILDGRTNNARFLENNFKRKYEVKWDKNADITTFELKEERLGKYNVIGSDFF